MQPVESTSLLLPPTTPPLRGSYVRKLFGFCLPCPFAPDAESESGAGTRLSAADDNSDARPLRILCLHSFRTNAAILEAQMAMLGQSALFLSDDLATLSYLDAPHVADEDKVYEVIKRSFPFEQFGAHRHWWDAEAATGPYGGGGPAHVDLVGKDAALHLVEETLRQASPPFDGILGFSQGGCLAMWLATLQQRGMLDARVPPIKFLVIQSSRLPKDHSCVGLFDASLPKIALPAFVSLNEDDGAVRPDETRALIAQLEKAVVVQRPRGGHSLMSVRSRGDADAAHSLRSFLQAQQQCAGRVAGVGT